MIAIAIEAHKNIYSFFRGIRYSYNSCQNNYVVAKLVQFENMARNFVEKLVCNYFHHDTKVQSVVSEKVYEA